ncbi:MAG: hydroxylamine reductase [Pseudomonadota bacterium]|nr:hydroxylamine reductase [Pseudomonadota bacterium]
MFCYQCEQTTRKRSGDGCRNSVGTCGKDALTADLQDLLIYLVKGISQYAHRARPLGVVHPPADRFVLDALFTTLTNVNFDPDRFVALVHEAAGFRDQLRASYEAACAAQGITAETPVGPATCVPGRELERLQQQAAEGAITVGLETVGADVVGLRSLVLYGVKGVAAYAHHAMCLGRQSDEVFARIHDLLSFLADNPADIDQLLNRALSVGELNLQVMQMLDAGSTTRFGHPEITRVKVDPLKGRAILVSGHDLLDLENILQQTEGTGINVYTHGELLPAHAYPGLKKYPHLAGNYGGAGQDQQREFAEFPGPVVMTSNCLIEPAESYRDRLFTRGPVGWPGITHIEDSDYSAVIAAARVATGFTEDGPGREITTGFAHNTVLGVADKVVGAVKNGDIGHFFVIGGCDGAKPGRNYFTDVAEAVPADGVILTLGCAKYRFNDHDFGAIDGIPRLLDVGQCNDSYSAVQIALALADAFDCGVNDLPLSLVISWLEQKAVAVLLTLLYLGIRDIRLGPDLPAFVTPAVLQVLSDKFNLMGIGDPREDMQQMLKAS